MTAKARRQATLGHLTRGWLLVQDPGCGPGCVPGLEFAHVCDEAEMRRGRQLGTTTARLVADLESQALVCEPPGRQNGSEQCQCAPSFLPPLAIGANATFFNILESMGLTLQTLH